MNKRLLQTLLLLTLLAWGVLACSKLEEEGADSPNAERPEGGSNNDNSSLSDTLTVMQALQAQSDARVLIKGYIVGYVDGTTISKAKFSTPTEKANTNLIIADSWTETDYTRCFPIQLKSGTEEHFVFNLYLNPQLLGQAVVAQGVITTYFKVNGFKHPNFWIDELEETEGVTPPEEETPPTEPETPTTPASETPTIDHTPQANIYGR